MLIDQVLNLSLLTLTQTERNFKNSFKNKLYMHFMMFANSESLTSIIKKNYPFDDEINDKDTYEY